MQSEFRQGRQQQKGNKYSAYEQFHLWSRYWFLTFVGQEGTNGSRRCCIKSPLLAMQSDGSNTRETPIAQTATQSPNDEHWAQGTRRGQQEQVEEQERNARNVEIEERL